MKKLFSNSFLVIALFLIINVFADALSYIFPGISMPLFISIRSIFCLYLILGIMFKYKTKMNYTFLSIVLVYSLLYLLFQSINTHVVLNIINYSFIILLSLYIYNLYIYEDKKINRNIITIALTIYLIFAIVFHVLGFINNYGFYYEVSSLISICLPFLIVNLEKRINFIEIIAITLCLYTALLIGTKLPLMVFLICLLYLLIKKFIKDAKNKEVNYTNIILFILFLITFIYKFNQTPLYQNLANKIQNLNINNPIDVLSNFKLFDFFVFSGRLSLLNAVNLKVSSSTYLIKLFGLKRFTLINMDLFDLLYNYGTIGFIIFIVLLTVIFKKIINRKNIKVLPIFIILSTSILSGRVFLSPSISMIAIIILSNTLYHRKRKKILISSYNLGVGGIESALVSFIKNINKDNHEIHLYLEKKEGKLLKEIPKNVIVKQQKVFNIRLRLLSKTLNTLNKIKFLITNFKEYDFSCCYATYSKSSNFLARYASNNNSIYIHSDYTQLYKNNISDINNFFKVRKLDKFKHIIFVSNESRDNLISIYPRLTDKAIVINNFIDEEKIKKLSLEKIDDNKPRGKKLFLFVGRIDEKSKNLTRLIDSFEIALQKNNKIVLWIVGNGPDYKKIKDYIISKKLDKSIVMLGEKINPYPYFKLTDFVILTSDYEGFPVIYSEAIIFNKPIISTIDVSDDFISIPNNFGYICKKDEKDIASTILKLINNDHFKYKIVDFNEINSKKYDMIKKML